MTDILDLKGWTVHSKTQSDGEYVIEAEYTAQPASHSPKKSKERMRLEKWWPRLFALGGFQKHRHNSVPTAKSRQPNGNIGTTEGP